MADIRPVDLPELRAEALRHQTENRDVQERMWASVDEREQQDFETARKLQNLHAFALGHASLFWVSEDMGQLAVAAGESLTSFVINEQDPAAKNGLMVFAKTLPTSDRWPSGDVARLRALAWTVLGAGGGYVVPYYDRDEAPMLRSGLPKLLCSPVGSFGFPYRDREWASVQGARTTLLPTLLAAWLLMQQPLADVSEVEADRAARKRLRRAGYEPKPVRVIELRRPKSSGEQGEGSRDYQHQWIVRGHWRNHWHPKREVHRPVWIAPHVKGPEGAPMIGGEKVYAWKR